jgi:hypothetical protein
MEIRDNIGLKEVSRTNIYKNRGYQKFKKFRRL